LQTAKYKLQTAKWFFILHFAFYTLNFAVSLDSGPAPKFELRRHVEQIVPVRFDDSIMINCQFGNVQVSTWPQSNVKVAADLVAGANSKSCAESCLDRMSIQVQPQGRRVDVQAAIDKGCCSATRYQANLVVMVPQMATLVVDNSYGDVSVDGLGGPVKTSNRFGATSINRSRQADVTSAFGDVSLGRIAQGVEVHSRFGTVRAHDLTGPMDVSNEGGAIYLTRGSGRAKLDNKLGEIMVDGCSGHFEITGNRGAVIYHDAHAGPDTVIITTSMGSIHLTLPAAANARVNTRTIRGRVECSLAPLVLAAGPARDETTHCYQFGRPPELTDAAAVGEAFFDLTTSGAEIIIDTAH
jgi:hypothetical protein